MAFCLSLGLHLMGRNPTYENLTDESTNILTDESGNNLTSSGA